MKRITTLLVVVFLVVTASDPYSVAASRLARTVVLRVKSADSVKSGGFSGWYKTGESEDRVQIVDRSTRFGIKLQTDSLSANFRKEAGGPDITIEVIEFVGEIENGSVTGTGTVLDVEVRPFGEGVRMSVRPVQSP